MIKVVDALRFGEQQLKHSNIETSYLDAEVLLRFVLKYSKEVLYMNLEYDLNDKDYCLYQSLIETRKMKKPIQYITGNCEFMGMDFYVDESVLIPRPDTEILVEQAIKELKSFKNAVLVDLCTGSGCIAISLARYLLGSNVIASDISIEALYIASKNAEKNNLNNKIAFIHSDLFMNYPKAVCGKVDAIISNPPYIKERDILGLEDNVKLYEPYKALCGGDTGLDFYVKITEQSKEILCNNGLLMFEIGHDQAEDVESILSENGFYNIKKTNDLAGHLRVIMGYYNKSKV